MIRRRNPAPGIGAAPRLSTIARDYPLALEALDAQCPQVASSATASFWRINPTSWSRRDPNRYWGGLVVRLDGLNFARWDARVGVWVRSTFNDATLGRKPLNVAERVPAVRLLWDDPEENPFVPEMNTAASARVGTP